MKHLLLLTALFSLFATGCDSGGNPDYPDNERRQDDRLYGTWKTRYFHPQYKDTVSVLLVFNSDSITQVMYTDAPPHDTSTFIHEDWYVRGVYIYSMVYNPRAPTREHTAVRWEYRLRENGTLEILWMDTVKCGFCDKPFYQQKDAPSAQ